MSQIYEQFYSIAKQLAAMLCPGARYEGIELLNTAKGLKAINTDDGLEYRITFNRNLNKICVAVFNGEEKIIDAEYKMGTKSIALMVDDIRLKVSTPKTLFGKLLKKQIK